MTRTLQSLQASNLACIRGQRALFRNLSFSLRAGDALAIEGPNGAGKTSLLRMLAGLLPQAAGTIRFTADGGAIEDGEERGHWVGFLAHHDAIKSQLTTLENLRFFASLYAAQADVESALGAVGLSAAAELPGRYLSAGQKKRLALARLKLSNRPLWLLDEPLSSLDAQGRALAAATIAAHCAQGGIAIAASHEPLGLDCVKLRLGT